MRYVTGGANTRDKKTQQREQPQSVSYALLDRVRVLLVHDQSPTPPSGNLSIQIKPYQEALVFPTGFLRPLASLSAIRVTRIAQHHEW